VTAQNPYRPPEQFDETQQVDDARAKRRGLSDFLVTLILLSPFLYGLAVLLVVFLPRLVHWISTR